MKFINESEDKQSWKEAKKSGFWIKSNRDYLWKYPDSDGKQMVYGQIKDAGYVKNQSYSRYQTSDKTNFLSLKDAKTYELDTYTYERLKKDGYVK